jgi:hypothetical protein
MSNNNDEVIAVLSETGITQRNGCTFANPTGRKTNIKTALGSNKSHSIMAARLI